MVKHAREGRIIVRLKGGEAMIFGRGGEEADFLAKAGVDFEIVPGVTAAVGAAAFAGVPLTDRRFSSCVTFVTAREGEGESPGIDWQALARLGGTIAVYMGRANMGEVTAALMHAGMNKSTAAVVVERATTPSQRVVGGTLGDIADKCDEAGVAAPCVTIIGEVARTYPALAWFERLPLAGRSIVLTRGENQQEGLAGAFEALGADVIRLATIEIVPSDEGILDEGVSSAGMAQWVVFTSANGVRIFFDALERRGEDTRALGGKRVAAIGTATARALGAFGIKADLVPSKFTGKTLLEELLAASRCGETFFLWRAQGARRELADGLKAAGRVVTEVAAYRAAAPREIDTEVVDRIRKSPPAAMLFSSASTAVNFASVIGKEEFLRLAGHSRIVSIGPVTSEALEGLGIRVDAEADPHSAAGLLAVTAEALGFGEIPPWALEMASGG